MQTVPLVTDIKQTTAPSNLLNKCFVVVGRRSELHPIGNKNVVFVNVLLELAKWYGPWRIEADIRKFTPWSKVTLEVEKHNY